MFALLRNKSLAAYFFNTIRKRARVRDVKLVRCVVKEIAHRAPVVGIWVISVPTSGRLFFAHSLTSQSALRDESRKVYYAAIGLLESIEARP